MAMHSEYPVWINGSEQNELSVTDRGLAYGDGLFETIRISDGYLTFEELHWRRLQDGCDRLSIKFDFSLLLTELEAYLESTGPVNAILKVIITRGSGGRGYNPDGCVLPSRILSLHAMVAPLQDFGLVGVRVKACRIKLGKSMLAGIKHLNRLEQVLARAEWQGAGFQEGLVADFEGNVIEGTMSNLFLVNQEGRLLTPDLSFSGVNGVCRQFILESVAEESELKVSVEMLKPVDIFNAAEVFLCNSVNGIWPVVEYENMNWSVGPVARQVRKKVLEALDA